MNAQTKVAKNVHQKLSDAREQFHAVELRKTGKANNRTYFELEDFLPDALRIFREQGLVTTPVTFREGYARMDVVNMDDPADCITCESPMGSADLKGCHEVQNIGAVQTYQRRYLWMNVLEIHEHDQIAETNEMPDANYAKIAQLVEVTKSDIPLLMQAIGVDRSRTLKSLAPAEYEKAISALENKLAKIAKEDSANKARETADA